VILKVVDETTVVNPAQLSSMLSSPEGDPEVVPLVTGTLDDVEVTGTLLAEVEVAEALVEVVVED